MINWIFEHQERVKDDLKVPSTAYREYKRTSWFEEVRNILINLGTLHLKMWSGGWGWEWDTQRRGDRKASKLVSTVWKSLCL